MTFYQKEKIFLPTHHIHNPCHQDHHDQSFKECHKSWEYIFAKEFAKEFLQL